MASVKGTSYQADIITNGYLFTQNVADILEKCRVQTAQITLDGLGAAHDTTRHLAGGGPTFERITQNLRALKLPFRVSIRHNVYAGNADQIEPLHDFVETLAKESGNDIVWIANGCLPALGAVPPDGSTTANVRVCRTGTRRRDTFLPCTSE